MPTRDLPDEEAERDLEHLLEELRVALPGVQILFAFLLTVAFANRFADVSAFQKDVYFVTLLCTLASSVFLIAPTSYHRLRFRRHTDLDLMLRTFNVFALLGLAFLAAALTAAILLVSHVAFGPDVAIPLTTATGTLLVAVWYLVPLRRFLSD